MTPVPMPPPLPEALRQAAELQKRLWKAYEPIFAALGYPDTPAEHVVDAVVKGVEEAALALGTDQERIRLFGARKAIEQKRAVVVPEEDQCWSCGEPLGTPDENGLRECPECGLLLDRSGDLVRQG
jgi:predicted RNA-binding Zn-ribbon protein involved in translation (DUF1610 family)